MKRVLYVAGPVGLALVVIGAGWAVFAPRLAPLGFRLSLVLGLVLLALGAWVRRDVLLQQGGRRTARMGAGALASVGLATAILLLVNFAAARYEYRWDMTRERAFSLQPVTQRVLAQVHADVDVYAFLPSEDRAETRSIKELYDLFAFHQPHIRVTVADPNQRPELLTQLSARGTKMTVVARGDRKVVFPIATNDQIRAAEGHLASALLEVAREQPRVVYWVIGHGERTIEADGGTGYGRLVQALGENFCVVRTLSLGPGEQVPADASLLVFMDPKKPLPAAEAAIYDRWLRAGNRVLVFEDVDAAQVAGQPDPMAPLLERWGLRPRPAFVMDPRGRTGETDPRIAIGDVFGAEAVTSLKGSRVVMPLARPIEWFTVSGDQQIFHNALVMVGPGDAQGKGNDPYVSYKLDVLRSGNVAIDPAERQAWLSGEARLAVMMAAFRKVEPVPGDPRPVREPRVVLAGDADFLTDRNLDREANRELLLNVVRWMTGEDLLIRREGEMRIAKNAMKIEPNQEMLVMGLGVILPLGTFLTGWIVWFVRRSK